MNRVALWGIFALMPAAVAGAEPFVVDPDTGNNTFSAVFDAPLGERINAVSSSVSCELNLDEQSSTASGVCSVPLTQIRVDNEETKTEHFQQWSTNKKMQPRQCRYEAHFNLVHFDELLPGRPVKSRPRFRSSCVAARAPTVARNASREPRCCYRLKAGTERPSRSEPISRNSAGTATGSAPNTPMVGSPECNHWQTWLPTKEPLT